MAEIIGRCYGETTPTTVTFISKEKPSVGEYVYLEYADKTILGMINTLFRGSFTLSEDLLNPDTIERIIAIEGDVDHYFRGSVTILGDVEHLEIPRSPAPPGTVVYKADAKLLKKVFEMDNGIKIGSILDQPDVPVKVDVNKMVSRHLAILAMTGSGKSNATSVIIDELLKIGGTIVVFDMHAEYAKTQFKNGDVRTIPAKINPRNLSRHEYQKLGMFNENATNQLKYLRDAYDIAEKEDKNGSEVPFVDNMLRTVQNKIDELEGETPKNQSHIDANYQVKFKLDDMLRNNKKILSSTDTADIVDTIVPGRVNVINLGELNEVATDIIVNHTLNNILVRRKNAVEQNNGKQLDFPVFCIIEEAHMLAANSRNTKSKYTISKIAREGRKFGVGLCLVSQSPKSLDSDSLSQVNNMIILRLVEPGDQKHVQKSSENLSNELLEQLPSLNIGEAVILGQMTKVPTMVKIDEFKGKSIGGDLDIVSIWGQVKKEREEQARQEKEEVNLLL